MNLAIIPARSGSKGLVDKNIRNLNGKPLMEYSIKAAIKSGCFDEVMVSTDSEKYADIAISCGAKVPFLRSSENSSDRASSWGVVREVLNGYREQGIQFDMVTLLQPTSPLRTAADIINAYEIFKEKQARSVISVCEMETSPLLCNTLREDNCLEGFISPEIRDKRRQDLPQYYRLNGAIYICRVNYSDMQFELYGKDSYAYIMSPQKSVDIDTEFDFFLAEQIIKCYSYNG
ncbi:MAG: acylneuraminate cytidylyltransferase family protein [Lachnospiraceae bacterium]|nr:acylneuraminate cytidylyltransferase family protein [Lachnospiraceae bacterium]